MKEKETELKRRKKVKVENKQMMDSSTNDLSDVSFERL